jgi:hypothetical protein
MNTEEIRELLAKYYNAECSEEEESRLKEYFASGTVPDEFLNDKEIFGYYSHASEIPESSAGFGERIISSFYEKERIEKVHGRRKFILVVSGIAAGLAILTGVYFFLERDRDLRDTYSDPETAYNEAMIILYNVSGRLNNGTKGLRHVAMMQDAAYKSLAVINRPADIIKHKMKPLGELNKAIVLIRKDDNK